jgi:hypothetical protein
LVDPKIIKKVAQEIAGLVVQKNEAYGDSYAKSAEILRVLYPDGISPEQYEDVLGMARLIDKQFRIANHKDAFAESPWRDICGYGLIASASAEAKKGGAGNA